MLVAVFLNPVIAALPWGAQRFGPGVFRLAVIGSSGSGKSLPARAGQSHPLDLATSSNGQWLATGSRDNTSKLWNLTTPESQSVTLYGHSAEVTALDFDPEGRWLVSGSQDGTVRLWRLHLDELIKLACRTAGRNLTPDEWRERFLDQPYRATCP